MIRRLRYYLASIPTLLGQIKNWYACWGLLLNPRPTVIKLRGGCRFNVRNLMDVWIVKETCLDRDYEVNAIPIQDGWTIMDIGAGLGDFAVSVAYEHPRCQVYAYEPFPESFRLLEDNIALNATNNVRAYPLAVGAEPGEMTLFATGAAVQHTTQNALSSAPAMAIRGVSLDDVFADNQLAVCHFLKMDCEGGEFDILFNASEATLKKLRHICLEYHNDVTEFSHIDLSAYLQSRGFQVKTTPNPVHRHLGFLYAWQ